MEVFTLKNLPYGINHLIDAMREGEIIDPKLIFDVGANIGQTSAYMRKAFVQSEIYAFEPVNSTFRELLKNVPDKEVKKFNIGFGDTEECVKIFLQQKTGLNSLVESLNKPVDSQSSEEVVVTTIDKFCQERQINEISLLKIDTEGFGLRVLKGAESLLKKGGVKSIFIEVGFDEEDLRHDHSCEVNKVLKGYSFKLFGFYNQWIDKARLEYCNAFFILN